MLHFAVARPEIGQMDGLAVLARSERLAREVDIERAGEGVSHDQRRRGQEVHAHFRMYAALEVAVAREHRAPDEVLGLHRRGDLRLERPAVADAVMHAHRARHEGMQIVDRQIEHRSLARRTQIRYVEREGGQCQRVLRDTIAFGTVRRVARLQPSKPIPHSHLPEKLDGRGELTAVPMQWLEALSIGVRQAGEAVVTFQQRVVREYRGLLLHQLRGRHAAGLLKSKRVVLPMQRFQPVRHPQALPVDRVDGAPVHGCSTRAQRLVHAVPKSHALDERQAIGQFEANLDASCAIASGCVAR